MKNKKTIETDLLGERVIPGDQVDWKLKPNLTGERFGTIRAVWIDDCNHVMILLKGPQGDIWETYLIYHTIKDKGVGTHL